MAFYTFWLIFCLFAFVFVITDRPGLRNIEHIERVSKRIQEGLHALMKSNHPDNPKAYQELLDKTADLRTMNTLHSEKLTGMTIRKQEEVEEKPCIQSAPYPPVSIPSNGLAYPPPMPPPTTTSSGMMMSPLDGAPVLPEVYSAENPMTAAQQVVLQTSMGTFHRYTTSPPFPPPPREPAAHSNRSSPDPLEMDLPKAPAAHRSYSSESGSKEKNDVEEDSPLPPRTSPAASTTSSRGSPPTLLGKRPSTTSVEALSAEFTTNVSATARKEIFVLVTKLSIILRLNHSPHLILLIYFPAFFSDDQAI